MPPSLLPSLTLAVLVVGLLLPACAGEQASGPSTPRARGEAPTVANTPEPKIPAKIASLTTRLPKRGDTLPRILGTTIDGTSVSNADIAGKTALINLWFYH